MTEKERKGLARARAELARWRRDSGGRGRRIPDELWANAVGLARAVGLTTTAHALKLDPVSLEARLKEVEQQEQQERLQGREQAAFVEIGGLPPGSAVTVVELVSRDGERMRIEIGGPLDVLGLSRAFWSQRP